MSSSTQVMTMRTPPQRQSSRSGPLAPSVDLQCLCGACSCLRRLRTCKSSQILYYVPSRRNRRSTTVHGDQANIRNILHWCFEAAKRFSTLVAIFLAIRVVIDLVLYICQLQLIVSASKATERIPSLFPSMSTSCHTWTSSPKSTETTLKAAAVLQFVSDHIMHASSAVTLTAGFTTRLRVLLDKDRVDMKALLLETQVTGQHKDSYSEEETPDFGINFTDPRTPLIDFTPGGLIGKTFTHALDALDHLSTSSSSDPPCLREDHEARVLAVYHRTASNLLLEYSAAQLRVRRLLFDLRTIHQRLTAKGTQWKDSRRTQRVLWLRDPSYAPKEVIGETVASRLEAVLGESTTLVSYLDRITEKLAQLNASEWPTTSRETDLSASWNALRDLFVRSTVSPRQRWTFSGSMNSSYATLKRVKVVLPKSTTIRMAWWFAQIPSMSY